MKIYSIYYHNPLPEQLERMVKRYQRKGYRFISVSELKTILFEQKTVNEKIMILTLDDGWNGNLALLPIIEKYQIPICIFVATEPVRSGNFWWEYIKKDRGRNGMMEFKGLPYESFYRQLNVAKGKIRLNRSALTIDDLKLLAGHELVTIQSHTVNHPILTSVPDDILIKELEDSKKELEGICGYNMFAFSYPNGSLSEREVSATSKFYQLAFTTEQRHISLEDNPLLLPRIDLTGDYYRDLLKVWGVWPYIKKMYSPFFFWKKQK